MSSSGRKGSSPSSTRPPLISTMNGEGEGPHQSMRGLPPYIPMIISPYGYLTLIVTDRDRHRMGRLIGQWQRDGGKRGGVELGSGWSGRQIGRARLAAIAAGRESVRNRRPHIHATVREAGQDRRAHVRWRRQRALACGRRIGGRRAYGCWGAWSSTARKRFGQCRSHGRKAAIATEGSVPIGKVLEDALDATSRDRETRKRGGEGTHDGLSGGSAVLADADHRDQVDAVLVRTCGGEPASVD